MPWSGGTFTRIENWVADKNAGIPITASRMDTDSNDFTSGINSCLNKDGSNTPTSNMNWGNLRLTALAPGTALTDAANVQQVQTGILNWGIAGGTSDALTLTLSPADTSIDDGTVISVRAGSANTMTAPTFALNGTTARAITKRGGAILNIGDIAGQFAEILLRYNSANTRWELLNPQNSGGLVFISSVTASATATLDFTANITSAFDQYVFRFSNLVPVTDNQDLWIRYSQSAAFSSASNYNYSRGTVNTAGTPGQAGTTADSKIIITAGNANTAGAGATGEFILGNPAGTSNFKSITGNAFSSTSGGALNATFFGGNFSLNQNAVDGIRFLFASGNVSTGFVAMYGVRKS